MGYATESRKIKSSRKKHMCDWCNTGIDVGTPYFRWRWYESGDACTVKSHPECLDACNECDYEDRIFSGENPRGCNCGHDKHCERCEEIKEILSGEPHH